ncbi:MAG TPA: hypothetical protein VEK32_06610 [Thermodesulfobacteriota bacterium]|nr:hypothetical protein [Thermodesulfobacteriota bacterium]
MSRSCPPSPQSSPLPSPKRLRTGRLRGERRHWVEYFLKKSREGSSLLLGLGRMVDAYQRQHTGRMRRLINIDV